jgi:hypothetical protein
MKIFVLFVMLMVSSIQATDVRWISSESEENNLPLSENYRDSLRKLCDILRSGDPLPPQIVNQKDELEKKCDKLYIDDIQIAGSENSLLENKWIKKVPKWTWIAAIGFGCIVYNRKRIFHQLKSFGGSDRRPDNNANAVREARLKKFS